MKKILFYTLLFAFTIEQAQLSNIGFVKEVFAQESEPIASDAAKIDESKAEFYEDYSIQDKALDTLTDNPSDQIQLKLQEKLNAILKKFIKADESVTITLENSRYSDLKFKLFDFTGNEVGMDLEVISDEDPVVVKIHPPVQFKPGRYRIKVEDSQDNIVTKDFIWGVLAINTNKSVYTPGEKASIQMAVLDEVGEMVCNADLTLTIVSPDSKTSVLSSNEGTIIVNPQCYTKDLTSVPDYQSVYEVGEAGFYSLELKATTKNGTNTIKDTIEVQETVEYDVERKTATRIYPINEYPVTLKVAFNEDFNGTIKDYVPASFKLSKSTNPDVISYDSIANGRAESDKNVLGAEIFKIGKPYKGDHEITLGFGRQHKDPNLGKKYTQFGVVGHDGVDFSLPMGTTVISVDDGKVVRAKEKSDYGTTIVIQHSWGKSYYGHLDEMMVEVGDKVKKGDTIALSGNTGLSSGPHLHFGIKPEKNDSENGYYGKVNPLPVLGLDDPGVEHGTVAGVSTSSTGGVENGIKEITWNIKAKKGQSIELGYVFDAPDISPELYLTGPLEIRDSENKLVFQEKRHWQIASDAVVVNGGIITSEAQFGGLQRKVAYVNSNWYAFYNDGTDVFYKKSADGITWGSAVNLDSAEDNDADNYNPSIDTSGNFIHVFWMDESADQVQGVRLDTTSDTTTQTSVCGLNSPGAFAVSTYMPSVAALSASKAIVAYGDTTNGANVDVFDVTTLDGATCTVTDASPGNLVFGSGISGSVTNGTRPILVGLDSEHAMMVWRDNTNLKSAIYNAVNISGGDDWISNNTTIATNSDTTYSAVTDGTSVWVLTQNSTTGTLLYKCCTDDLNAQELDSDIGGSINSNDSDIAIYCINSSDCKVAYTDDIDAAAPTLIFVDCGSDGSGGRDAAGDDPHCTTKSTVTLDSDIGATNDVANPDIYCVASNNCKVVYGDDLDTAGPDYTFVDCADENCTAGTATFFDISGDFGAAINIPYISVDCVGGDTDCKVVLSDNGNQDDLSFVDCSASNCNSTTLVDIDTAAGEDKKNELYCLTATNCKVIYHDVATTDVVFVNCGGAGTPASCTTLSGDTTILLSTASSTPGSVPVDVDCVGGDTECRAVYVDDTATDAVYVDCNASALCASPNQTTFDVTARSGDDTSVSLSCLSISDCKFTYNGTPSSIDSYFVDCAADDGCTNGTVYTFNSSGLKADIWCVGATDCKLAYYDGFNGVPTVKFGDCDTSSCLPTWSTLTAPWTSETNVTSVSLTYDSTNSDLIANVIKGSSECAYYRSSDASTISWGTSTLYDFTPGDLDNISTPESAAGTSLMGVLLRQGSNVEFDLLAAGSGCGVAGPTLDQSMRHGKWFTGGVEQPFTF